MMSVSTELAYTDQRKGEEKRRARSSIRNLLYIEQIKEKGRRKTVESIQTAVLVIVGRTFRLSSSPPTLVFLLIWLSQHQPAAVRRGMGGE
jgi:hypothetical protein